MWVGRKVAFNQNVSIWEMVDSVQFSSLAQSYPTLCDPMDCSTPGFPVHHLLELTQTHAISWWCLSIISSSVVPFSSHFNLSQHHGLFQGVSSSHQVAKVLEFHFSISPSNEYSGQISFRMDWLNLLAVQGTLKSFPKPQFKSISSSVLSFLYSLTLTSIHDYWKNHSFDYIDLCWQSNASAF